MSEKYPHEFVDQYNRGFKHCIHCGQIEEWAVKGVASRRCTHRHGAYWAGPIGKNELRWARGEVNPDVGSGEPNQYDFHVYGAAVYDPHYDIDPADNLYRALVDEEDHRHIPGIDPEEIDWAAHKAWLGESR